ncbi:DNA primase [Carbonactinospora thermoautotrophica]|nr:DNA primase [Carbonactinospora thermoautotrophica]
MGAQTKGSRRDGAGPTGAWSTGAEVDREALLAAAIRYAEDRHWQVAPGHHLVRRDARVLCSCGRLDCTRPGAHPLSSDWAVEATTSGVRVRQLWGAHPDASIILPAGRMFDVIDVPELAGCLALARLERQGKQLGPVLSTPGRRLQFFVLPGMQKQLPDLVRRLGWKPERLDLRYLGKGEYVVAPPSNAGLALGATHWVRPPVEANRWLPDARELIAPIAYACAR